jgi:hypothetical protein
MLMPMGEIRPRIGFRVNRSVYRVGLPTVIILVPVIQPWRRRTAMWGALGPLGGRKGGYRRLCEYIWAGAIGEVPATHSWTGFINWGADGRPPVKTGAGRLAVGPVAGPSAAP